MNKHLRSEQEQKDFVFWYRIQFFDLTKVLQVRQEVVLYTFSGALSMDKQTLLGGSVALQRNTPLC